MADVLPENNGHGFSGVTGRYTGKNTLFFLKCGIIIIVTF
jgi:hypothetical protein